MNWLLAITCSVASGVHELTVTDHSSLEIVVPSEHPR